MDKTNCDRLKITAFLDGRPGHEKQTKGVLSALGQLIDIDVSFVNVPYNSVWKDLLSWFALLLPGSGEKKDENTSHLAIGTGRRTHLPILHLKKSCDAKALACMSPSSYLRGRFDLCFVPEHDGIVETGNVFHTVGPPNVSEVSSKQLEKQGLILIGGTDTSHHWSDEDIRNCIAEIARKDEKIIWTISSSPRTPASCVVLIEKTCKQYENCIFYDYRDTPSGWVEEQYALSRKVWVTADSMSMVYEGLTAGCSVGLISVDWKNKNSKFAKSERQLIQNNIVISYQNWSDGSVDWILDNSPLNESMRCAEEIVRRWFRKN